MQGMDPGLYLQADLNSSSNDRTLKKALRHQPDNYNGEKQRDMLYLEEGEDWLKLNDRDYNYIHNNIGSEDIKAWKAKEMIAWKATESTQGGIARSNIKI